MDSIELDSQFSPAKLLRVFLTLFLLHLAFTGVLDTLSSYTSLVDQVRHVDRKIITDRGPSPSAAVFSTIDQLQRLSTWPLHHFNPENSTEQFAYSVFKVPWLITLLNSLCNAVLLLLLLNILASMVLSENNTIRLLLRGCGSKDAHRQIERISLRSNDPGVYRTAKQLKSLERFRYGPILIIGILHYAILGVANLFSVATRIRGGATPEVVHALRFPLTPLVVDRSFWEASQGSGGAQLIVACSNSLLWGLLLTIIYTIARSLSGHK